MARLPYADLDAPALEPLVERIVAGRGSVLHLYQMLLHSPAVADGWLTLLTAVRQQTRLPGRLRELVIMRIAMLNRAPYEADQHAPIALREGVTSEQIEALDAWASSERFDALERAVLALADTMTREVQVPVACLESVRRHLDDGMVVELVVTVAAYNMVSRFLEALAIHSDDPR